MGSVCGVGSGSSCGGGGFGSDMSAFDSAVMDAIQELGPDASQEEIEAVAEEFGMSVDDPAFQQMLQAVDQNNPNGSSGGCGSSCGMQIA